MKQFVTDYLQDEDPQAYENARLQHFLDTVIEPLVLDPQHIAYQLLLDYVEAGSQNEIVKKWLEMANIQRVAPSWLTEFKKRDWSVLMGAATVTTTNKDWQFILFRNEDRKSVFVRSVLLHATRSLEVEERTFQTRWNILTGSVHTAVAWKANPTNIVRVLPPVGGKAFKHFSINHLFKP